MENKGSILIVDDDVELCELVREYLAGEGFQLEAVYSGDAGLAKALEGDYSLIILDIMLPKLHGFELLRTIRAKPATKAFMEPPSLKARE